MGLLSTTLAANGNTANAIQANSTNHVQGKDVDTGSAAYSSAIAKTLALMKKDNNNKITSSSISAIKPITPKILTTKSISMEDIAPKKVISQQSVAQAPSSD